MAVVAPRGTGKATAPLLWPACEKPLRHRPSEVRDQSAASVESPWSHATGQTTPSFAQRPGTGRTTSRSKAESRVTTTRSGGSRFQAEPGSSEREGSGRTSSDPQFAEPQITVLQSQFCTLITVLQTCYSAALSAHGGALDSSRRAEWRGVLAFAMAPCGGRESPFKSLAFNGDSPPRNESATRGPGGGSSPAVASP